MSITDPYDVIIIGTGAGGGTLAHRLAPSGLRILILERGDFIPRERENWDPRAVAEQKRYLAPETWFDKDDRPFSPYTHYCVGGNTKVYGAALLRLRERDFGEVRQHGGLSPAWPVGYDEFEPYYAQAEGMYSVHGERGADPNDPRASGPYPRAALAHEPRIARLLGDLRALGCNPFPCPLGVRLGEDSRSAAPVHLSRFDGYPDPTECKADSHVVGVRPALEYPNVTLLRNGLVERLECSSNGERVTRVIGRHEGRAFDARGEVVVVSCGAINSAALLLRSACAAHPGGLGNRSDQVGRNYMTHNNGLFVAVTREPNPSAFQKTFGVTDFYYGDPGVPGSLPLGTIQLMGKPDPVTLAWLAESAPPGADLADLESRTIDFFITAEDLPEARNRISLRGDGSIRVTYHETNRAAYDGLRRKLESLLRRVADSRGEPAPVFLHQKLGVSGVSHQNGTLRFGTDPNTSVLNTDCRSHEVDNLYVVDGSFFPSSSAVNPSLTIMANALRVGDHLLDRFGTRAATSRMVSKALTHA
ncbi:MAG: GMC oxidoreductase [Phycisphaerales bacterium]